MTTVAYTTSKVAAGTVGDESCFSVSTDDGNAFNDLSLIDTTLSVYSDVAVSADAAKVYLATYDTTEGSGNYDTSIWVKEGSTWWRTFSSRNIANTAAAFRIDVAPENAAAIYMFSAGTQNMWTSKDSGEASWTSIPVYKLSLVQDFVIQNADTVYAIDTVGMSKSTNDGATWSDKVTTNVAAWMINLAPNNDILVGSSDGYIAYSKDGGATFTKKPQSVGATANTVVIADKDYATNNTVFIAANQLVKRSKADTTTDWTDRSPTPNAPASNMIPQAMARVDKVIYVMYNSNNSSASAIYRALDLLSSASASLANWSNLSNSKGDLENGPGGLSVSVASNQVKLWSGLTAGDFSSGGLFSMTDIDALVAPTQKAPANGAIISVNPGSGNPYNVTFSFSRYASDKITNMQIQIANDSAFNGIIVDTSTAISADPTGDTVALVLGPSTTPAAQFNPGTTYYWRVRVSQAGPMFSPWSTVGSFKIENPIPFEITSPTPGATGVPIDTTFVWTVFPGATSYTVQIGTAADYTGAASATVTNTFYKPASNLSYGTVYYWRVQAKTADNVTTPYVNGIFTTAGAPAPTPTPTVQPTPTITIVTPPPVAPIPAAMLWAIVIIGAILIIALIVLIVRTRRVA